MERKFIPGSEWLYFKLYTGVKTSDVILEEIIEPLLNSLFEENLITKWFFIRYHDPKSHLRIRFELNDISNYNQVIACLNVSLEDYINSGEISGFILDIYNREIERYGEKTIEDAEFLFFKSSDFILKECLYLDDEEKIIASIFYIDEFLNGLNLPINEKLLWIKNSNDGFKSEFNADKKLNSQLDKKYRLFKPKYLDFLESEDFVDFKNLIKKNLKESEFSIQNIFSKAEGKMLESIVQSLFHMHINRIFVSDQRLFEMIIYDYLHRYYKTLFFQNTQN
ncbi:thiopeptide-type bacteriocin biosynthesis protein [Chryseobacterium sp.]|uniref:thiopeptide-type bacteriocin biosynthesis protein n=1 Tax=Chryseobacterium sp. TaxID=1871047 RepID=UPI00289B10C2|nr:thiopeptide-type bacteriocin biosynthesis protein [Chryseobacterium sp.]